MKMHCWLFAFSLSSIQKLNKLSDHWCWFCHNGPTSPGHIWMLRQARLWWELIPWLAYYDGKLWKQWMHYVGADLCTEQGWNISPPSWPICLHDLCGKIYTACLPITGCGKQSLSGVTELDAEFESPEASHLPDTTSMVMLPPCTTTLHPDPVAGSCWCSPAAGILKR